MRTIIASGVFWEIGRHMFQSPLAVRAGLRPILYLTYLTWLPVVRSSPDAVAFTSSWPFGGKWASRTVARASAIAGALTANIGSYSDGKPAHRVVSEYAFNRPEQARSSRTA